MSVLTIFFLQSLFLLLLPSELISQDLVFNEKFSTRARSLSAEINSLNLGWKAEPQFGSWSMENIKRLMGVMPNEPRLPEEPVELEVSSLTVPDEFDARTQWPACPSISLIRDQSNCGSCWAFGAVESISDRICIASGGKITPEISAADLASCCWYCGLGCDGGFPGMAWHYWVNSGLVSGGLYGDKNSCKPYPLPPCEHHIPGPKPACAGSSMIGWCHRSCSGSSFNESYKADKHYGKRAYSVPSKEASIQAELMANGPVEATLTVYEDLLNYRSGVYKHATGSVLGGHAVRMLGWGVQVDHDTGARTPYWLIANSWNEDWGDRGYFRILRGKDECGIESGISAGIPNI